MQPVLLVDIKVPLLLVIQFGHNEGPIMNGREICNFCGAFFRPSLQRGRRKNWQTKGASNVAKTFLLFFEVDAFWFCIVMSMIRYVSVLMHFVNSSNMQHPTAEIKLYTRATEGNAVEYKNTGQKK